MNEELIAPTLRVALGEYDTGWHDAALSLARAGNLIREAKAGGAELVVLPEMCTTGFTMEARQSEPLDGPSIRELAHLARESGIHLLAGVATRSDGEHGPQFHNSALLIDGDGALVSEYRKQRLFELAGEAALYTAGVGSVVVPIRGVRCALLICFDLRFPELFRQVAAQSDAIVVLANWPSARQSHWETLLRARAIESQCFVIGVNRVGLGGQVEYSGGSTMYDPWGELVIRSEEGRLAMGEVKVAAVRDCRSRFPFVIPRASL